MTTGDLKNILNSAKREPVKDWAAYSKCKEIIVQLNLPFENYERAIKDLCEVLEL